MNMVFICLLTLNYAFSLFLDGGNTVQFAGRKYRMKKTKRIVDSNSFDSNIYWVCGQCGRNALMQPENIGKRQFQISTWHNGKCDVCKKIKPVTQTRDFMFPKFEVKEN